MICPKCKNELLKAVTYKRKYWFFKYKVFSFICSSCDFVNIKEVRISKQDYETSIKDRSKVAENTKILKTEKEYNQTYESGINPLIISHH